MGEPTETPTPEWMISRKEAAEVVYRDLKESQRATFEVASGYGRWLIASLVLIHGGGIVGAFGLLKDADGDRAMVGALTVAVVWLLMGLLLALGCGLSTWLNWSFHADNYGQMANAEMLWNPQAWAGEPIHGRGITISYWASIVIGVLSAACTIGAAATLLSYAAMAAAHP